MCGDNLVNLDQVKIKPKKTNLNNGEAINFLNESCGHPSTEGGAGFVNNLHKLVATASSGGQKNKLKIKRLMTD